MIYAGTNQQVYDFLLPDEGYSLHSVIATTYSLNAEHFIGLANCVRDALRGERRVSGSRAQENMGEICLGFDEIRETVPGVLRVYANGEPESSNAKLAGNAKDLYQLCGKTVQVSGGIFHPKLLLACMRRNDQEGDAPVWRFRMQISSANLTGSAGLELGAVFYGEESRGKSGEEVNGKTLQEFLETLDDGEPDWLDALSRTQFEVFSKGGKTSYTTEQVDFAFNRKKDHGILKKLLQEIEDYPPVEGTPILVYSPYLELDEDGECDLDCLATEGHDVLYHTNLTPKVFVAKNSGDNAKRIYAAGKDQPFLHGKMIIWMTEPKAEEQEKGSVTFRVWLGSANASGGGVQRNAELMAGFTFRVENRVSARYEEFTNETAEHKLWRVMNNTAVQKGEITFRLLTKAEEGDVRPDDGEQHAAMLLARSLQAELCRSKTGMAVRLSGGKFQKAEKGEWTASLTPVMKIERKALTSGVEWDIDTVPPAGVFLLRIYDKNDQQLVKICVQAHPEADSGITLPPAESMVTLLSELVALDAVPPCAVRVFTNPDDSLYQRMCAYLCSHCWDGSMDADCWKRLVNRVCTVYVRMFLMTSPKTREMFAEAIQVEEDDFAQVERLYQFLYASNAELVSLMMAKILCGLDAKLRSAFREENVTAPMLDIWEKNRLNTSYAEYIAVLMAEIWEALNVKDASRAEGETS